MHNKQEPTQKDILSSSKTDSHSQPILGETLNWHGLTINLKNFWSWLKKLWWKSRKQKWQVQAVIFIALAAAAGVILWIVAKQIYNKFHPTLGIVQIMKDSPGGLQVGRDVHIHESKSSIEEPVRKATAAVEVIIESDDDFDGIAGNVKAHLAFMKGQIPLLTTSVTGYEVAGREKGRVTYRANLTMPAGDAAVGRPIALLRETDYVLLVFGRMPPDSHVLSGRALCTINDFNIDFLVPEQVADGGHILIREVTEPLRFLNQPTNK